MSSVASSAGMLEQASLVGLHPLTRQQLVTRRVRHLVAQVPAPYSVIADGIDVPAVLTRLYAMAIRDRWGGGGSDTTCVLQLTPWYACDIGIELVYAGRIFGHAPIWEDMSPGLMVEPLGLDEGDAAQSDAPTPRLISVRGSVLDSSVREALSSVGRTIIVMDTARVKRADVLDAMSKLGQDGVLVAGLIVYRGRIPRDPSYG